MTTKPEWHPREISHVDVPMDILYDGYELATVCEYVDTDLTFYCEPADDPEDLELDNVIGVIYTVYGHKPGAGVEWIKDFKDWDEALKLYLHLCETLADFAALRNWGKAFVANIPRLNDQERDG